MYLKKRKKHGIYYVTALTVAAAAAIIVSAIIFAYIIAQAPAREIASSYSAGSHFDTQGADSSAPAEQLPILVNGTNPIPDGYAVSLTELGDGNAVSSDIYSDLCHMLDAARQQGIALKVNSSYRTAQDQSDIMDDKINAFVGKGYSHSEAVKLAQRQVAPVGYSEHQTGLAVDLTTEDYRTLPAQTAWTWLSEHCSEYGFIIRYPKDKESITGISYEPWHVRHVGRDTAMRIERLGICLEEYIELRTAATSAQ